MKAKVIYHQGHGMGNVDYNSKMGFPLIGIWKWVGLYVVEHF
jgi:hypothetical protein